MFSIADRATLRERLVDRAVQDEHIVGIAVVGSRAAGREDEFSDIDLALRLTPNAPFDEVVNDWTSWMIHECPVAKTMDRGRASALYRVFLLNSTLQVDLSFWSYDRFGGVGQEPFVVLYGEEVPAKATEAFQPGFALDTAWLYALHVRTSLARGRLWQALFMINGLRDQIVAVWADREGLNPSQARGIDQLTTDVFSRLKKTVPSEVTWEALSAAFTAEIGLLIEELPELSGVLLALLTPS